MNKAFNILLIAAVLVGLFSAFLVVRLLKNYQKQPTTASSTETAPAVETRKVAFAKVEIKPGTLLDKSLASMKDMPVALIPDGAYENLDDTGNVVARHYIPEGDMLLQSKFEKPESMKRASLIIPEGMRTITLATNEIRGNSYLVKAGDIVDIILSGEILDDDGNETGQTISRIFMQSVKVFDIVQGASGEERTGNEPEGAARSRRGTGTNVTFLVTPQEAELLHNADINTQLTLLLRRYDDTEVVQTTGVIDETLFDMVVTDDLRRSSPAPPPPPQATEPVEAPPTRLFY